MFHVKQRERLFCGWVFHVKQQKNKAADILAAIFSFDYQK